MDNENYIVINGNKAELTEEQLKQLGIEIKPNFDNANYFNDKYFANQVMLHQQLYIKLLKYAYHNNAEYVSSSRKLNVEVPYHHLWLNTIYFTNRDVTENAIKDIVKPFMKEHPEFTL